MKFASDRISILPKEPTALSGLQFREVATPTLGIPECNLRIAWLEINEKEKLIFFLADLLFFPTHLSSLLESFCQEKFSVNKENLTFAGTHTHSGPSLGFLPWEKNNHNYEEGIFEKTKIALVDLQKQLKDTRLETEEVSIGQISINRRKRIRHWKTGFALKALMLPNPKGPFSKWIRLVRFITEGEKPTVFLSYASHPVFNRNHDFSSDYPGRIAQLCQEELGVKEVFCFQGFGGDLRPNFQDKKGLKASLKKLFHGPEFANYNKKQFESFCRDIVMALKESQAEKTEVQAKAVRISRQDIAIHSTDQKSSRTLQLKVISLGAKLHWLTANGELFCAYQQSLPPSYFPIGCTAGTIGYIPTSQELKWGGYEVEDAPINNAMTGKMDEADIKKVEEYFSKLV